VAVMKSFTFWNIMPCSPVIVNGCFGGICLSDACFILVSCSSYSLRVRTEAICFSETKVRLSLDYTASHSRK
jgi:hypothetical protein